MKIPCSDRGHFRWRGMAYDPEKRRLTTFQCEDCNEVVKEYDAEILTALSEHDQRKHAETPST